MKTKIILKIVLSVMIIIMMMWTKNVNAQTTDTIYMDIVSGDVPYCQSSWNSIAIFAPAGVTIDHWTPGGSTANPLVMPSGYDGGITCHYVGGGSEIIYIHPVSPLTTPTFTNKTICGLEKDSLDGLNYSSYGFTTYLWSNGATTQTIVVGAGTYTVTVTNACNVVIHSATITSNNPTPPNLGADKSVCEGTSVILNPGSGYTNYLWSNGASTPTITITTGGPYWVKTTNPGGCQDMDTVNITFLQPTTKPICYAGYDTITSKNNIYLPTSSDASIDSLHIYVQVSSTLWNKIGAVKEGTPYFTDMNCTPQTQSYSYEIAVVDTCGNEGTKSLPHTTITLLSTYDQGTDTYGFTWSAYVGLVPSNYNIYGIDSSGAIVTQIGTVPGTQFFYNYVNPNHGYKKYFVGFPGPDCSSMKTSSIVKSNVLHSLLTGIDEEGVTLVHFSVYPNPATNFIAVQTNESIQNIALIDVVGRIVLTTNYKTINCENLPSGVYFVKVMTSKGIGLQKFVKE